MSEDLKLYAIHDRKVQNFAGITPFRNDDVALRMIGDWLARDSESVFVKHPEDFDLYRLGWFNPDNGHILGVELPEFVVSFVDVLKSLEEKPDVQ